MLDAGCGTGSYSKEFLKEGIGKLTMLDASEAMLSKAKSNVKDYLSNIAEIKQIELPKLPYSDNSFDAVAFILVLHHVDKKEDAAEGKYPVIEQSLNEAYRVLKPNGVLVVEELFDESHTVNPISLAPKASEIWKKRFIHENDLIDLIENSKFSNLHCLSKPNSSVFARHHWFHRIEGLLEPQVEPKLPFLTIMEETGEFEGVKKLIREKINDGTIDELKKKLSRYMRVNGLTTTVFTQKKLTTKAT